MGEPYRTLLGHFRHEIAHYYWDRLVAQLEPASRSSATCSATSAGLSARRCSSTMPTARRPTGRTHFVTAYASAHPWEDFAETWAHYFHMVDTLETAQRLRADACGPRSAKGADLATKIDFDPHDADMDRIIEAWLPLTFAMNSINRSMGLPDLYPFVLAPTVIVKLAFVHDRIRAQRDRGETPDGALRAMLAGLRQRSDAAGSTPRRAGLLAIRQIREFSGLATGARRRLCPTWPGNCLIIGRCHGRGRHRSDACVDAEQMRAAAGLNGDSRQSPSRHALPLRPAGQPRAAGDPAAAGAALPHAGARAIRCKVTPDAAFRELAAGPARQLARALRLSGEDRPSSRSTVDLVADMAVINPFDFFVEPYADNFPFAYRGGAARELAPYLEPEPAGPAARRVPRRDRRASRATPSTSWSSSTSACSTRSATSIRMEPGVQTPEETLAPRSGSCRDTAWLLVQILRHLGLAGALRLRLPDPAQARRQGARRAGRHRRRTSPTCTPGPRSICRAPAGSGSTRPPACSAGEGHIPLAATPHYRSARADHRRASSRPRSSSPSR